MHFVNVHYFDIDISDLKGQFAPKIIKKIKLVRYVFGTWNVTILIHFGEMSIN